jgi:hypothetical protein
VKSEEERRALERELWWAYRIFIGTEYELWAAPPLSHRRTFLHQTADSAFLQLEKAREAALQGGLSIDYVRRPQNMPFPWEKPEAPL